ncbi:helix-turn-helix domain-containing protein [Clostridium neonatale]|uniref:helix-turn-helix domain-containing protein n=1 Tax=Clostridium neonatale TaxID=137838 RepID=UPI003D33C824
MNSNAIFCKTFTPLTLNLSKELYKSLPENTTGEKIRKQCLLHGLEKEKFCEMISTEEKSLELWESHKIIPAPKSIKKICTLFNLPLDYFGEYYSLYYNHPEKLFLKWKNRNDYGYKKCISILECSESTLINFVNGKYGMSYEMYLKMEKVGIF